MDYLYKQVYGSGYESGYHKGFEDAIDRVRHNNPYCVLDADELIFNEPATIVKWSDGTKTVVKCQEGDTYDREKGVALCYLKKVLGNSSRMLNTVLKLAEVDE